MRNLLISVLFLALAGQVSAQSQPQPVTLQTCRSGAQQLLSIIDPGKSDNSLNEALLNQTVTAEGWCRINQSPNDRSDLIWTHLEWRAVGLPDWIAHRTPPTQLDIRIVGLRPTSAPAGFGASGSVSIWTDHEARQLHVENAHLAFLDGTDIQLSARFDNIDLSSWSMAQFSLGSLVLSRVDLAAQMTPISGQAIWPDLTIAYGDTPAQVQAGIGAWVQNLDATALSPGSADAIMSFVQTLPNSNGRLEITYRGAPGLSFLLLALNADALGQDDGTALSNILGNAVIDATWTPGSTP